MIESEFSRVDLHVEAVPAEALHDLRRRVLRGGDPAAGVSDPRDDEPTTCHFGCFHEERLIAGGSFYPSTSPVTPEAIAWQLRYLATEAFARGRGAGSLLLRAAETRLGSLGVDQLWANGRDSALGFYDREGWRRLAGSEHVSRETGLPHTVIVKDLRRFDDWRVDWATPHDADALTDLREEMYFSIRLREFPGPWLDGARRYFATELEDGRVIATVARLDSGEVVACAAAILRRLPPTPVFPEGADAYVHSVSTRPAHRRRGISRVLMSHLVAELERRGVERVELHATDQGEDMYRDLGFGSRGGGAEMRLALREWRAG